MCHYVTANNSTDRCRVNHEASLVTQIRLTCRYADDTVLIAENKEDLQKLLNIVEEESRKKGLELNSKKTKVMKNAPDTLDRKENNERVLNEANKRRSLVRIIRKSQATFLGHVLRRGKLEHLVTTGKFEGKRSRGRQREKIMDGLATWLGPGKVSDILAAVKDRDLWRDMIANAYKQGT
ncbi:hypothetical protein PoB_002797000 [Plakobranchus ocellatus]|uniref:Reverse transcriptase domain-containing protein n=1 Tax=Plakobranchus ocellatus TaxID=259542 RepID=A0AAV4A018_9GAST|nr:hypothetical protein PoB_002797000 [Plakobranchus ocellatus]